MIFLLTEASKSLIPWNFSLVQMVIVKIFSRCVSKQEKVATERVTFSKRDDPKFLFFETKNCINLAIFCKKSLKWAEQIFMIESFESITIEFYNWQICTVI